MNKIIKKFERKTKSTLNFEIYKFFIFNLCSVNNKTKNIKTKFSKEYIEKLGKGFYDINIGSFLNTKNDDIEKDIITQLKWYNDNFKIKNPKEHNGDTFIIYDFGINNYSCMIFPDKTMELGTDNIEELLEWISKNTHPKYEKMLNMYNEISTFILQNKNMNLYHQRICSI